MITTIIPHTAFKPNWRYAQFLVVYSDYSPWQTSSRVEWSAVIFYSPKNVYKSYLHGVYNSQLFGMPSSCPFVQITFPDGSIQTQPAATYTTNVNTNDNSNAKTKSYIYGVNRFSPRYWMPWHIFNFRVPINSEVTYNFTNNWYDPAYEYYYTKPVYVTPLVECEFLGEDTVNPSANYPQPTIPPY